MGIVRTKQRAREITFWPGMNRQIEDMIKNCPTCLEFRNKNNRELMLSTLIPELHWSHVRVNRFI